MEKEMWTEIVKKIREDTKDGRELVYKDGEIGITSLLSCPLKVKFRKERPDISPTAVEIDDGYVWEGQVKKALRSIFGNRFEEEKDLVDEVEGLKIRGHLDAFIELDDKVIGIELKAPKALILKEFPSNEELIDGVFLIDEEGKYVVHNPQYYLQARIQKHILEKLYPDKKVEQYLFYKAPVRRGSFERKVYVLAPVRDSISEEEYRELARRFREDPSPRYPNECSSYCEFHRAGVCEGREYKYEDTDVSRLDGETKELLREYREIQSQLKSIETLLRKKIKGSVRFGGREIGWVPKKTIKLREDKLVSLIPTEKIPEFFVVRWNKKEELIREFGEEIVEEVKEDRVWRV
ncbi:hypothetical protein [Hydrogenivirga sp.]